MRNNTANGEWVRETNPRRFSPFKIASCAFWSYLAWGEKQYSDEHRNKTAQDASGKNNSLLVVKEHAKCLEHHIEWQCSLPANKKIVRDKLLMDEKLLKIKRQSNL